MLRGLLFIKLIDANTIKQNFLYPKKVLLKKILDKVLHSNSCSTRTAIII